MKITETQSAENKGQYHSGSTDHDEHDDDATNNNITAATATTTKTTRAVSLVQLMMTRWIIIRQGSVSAEDDVN